jgi:hypothetical protein
MNVPSLEQLKQRRKDLFGHQNIYKKQYYDMWHGYILGLIAALTPH